MQGNGARRPHLCEEWECGDGHDVWRKEGEGDEEGACVCGERVGRDRGNGIIHERLLEGAIKLLHKGKDQEDDKVALLEELAYHIIVRAHAKGGQQDKTLVIFCPTSNTPGSQTP